MVDVADAARRGREDLAAVVRDSGAAPAIVVGSPTLEVSIDASGQLAEVVIRKSSGSRILDKAALDILRRASPFDPFPVEISAEYDSLRFAYKWLFSEEFVPSTASVSRQ